mgnify:FL=1
MMDAQRYATVGGNIGAFVDAWTNDNIGLALAYARQAQTLYLAKIGPDIQRAIENNPDIIWPIPGCPEADDAVGWTGWYGDYSGTGA